MFQAKLGTAAWLRYRANSATAQYAAAAAAAGGAAAV